MTTRNHARPVGPEHDRDPIADRRAAAGGEALGERLVAAREAKGIDLLRAERERTSGVATWPRSSAAITPPCRWRLRRRLPAELRPYLGIDPTTRSPSGVARRRQTLRAGDRRAAAAGLAPQGVRAHVGVVVAAVATLGVVLILAYIGFQLVRFPTAAAERRRPGDGGRGRGQDATTYTLRGLTIAGGLVTIAAPGRDPLNITAGGDGTWLATVDLRRGKNQFDVSAVDPKTGKAADHPIELLITVPFNPVVAPTLSVSSPADGATFQNGAIPVAGNTTDATA